MKVIISLESWHSIVRIKRSNYFLYINKCLLFIIIIIIIIPTKSCRIEKDSKSARIQIIVIIIIKYKTRQFLASFSDGFQLQWIHGIQ